MAVRCRHGCSYAQTGQFAGEVPAGVTGELRIKVIARDMQGREATSLFRVNIGVAGNKDVLEKDGGKAPAGKTGLSDQLRQRGAHMARDGRLATLARGANLPPRG